jgi:hypothetical protein
LTFFSATDPTRLAVTPHSKKRLVVSYVLLVGIPLLGVVGVLGAGRRLTAPISVAGSWDFNIDPSGSEAQSCIAGLGVTRSTVMDISQSGRYLTLTLNSQPKLGLQGTLRGTTVVANFTSPLETSCDRASGFSMTAEIDKAAPRMMSGMWKFDGCPSCGSANFQAVRQVLSTRRQSE